MPPDPPNTKREAVDDGLAPPDVEHGPSRLPQAARLVVAAAWASNLGDGIRLVALPLLAASVTDSATLIAAVAAAAMLPGAIFGAAVGVTIDRLDRRRIALVADVLRVAVVAVILVGVIADATTIGAVIAAAGALGVGETFRDLAGAALVADAVEDRDLEAANGNLIVAEVAGNTMLGPLAGSALWGVSRSIPLALDAVALTVSAAITHRLGALSQRVLAAPEPGRTMKRDLVDAWHRTWRDTTLRRILLTSTAVQTTLLGITSVEVIWALDRLDVGAIGLGAINATLATGAILAGLATKYLTALAAPRALLTGSLAVLAGASATYSATTLLPAIFVALFLAGAALATGDVALRAARVRAAGADNVGSVTGVIRSAMWAGGSAGALMGGLIAEHRGISTTFGAAAIVGTLVAVATVIWPPIPDAIT